MTPVKCPWKHDTEKMTASTPSLKRSLRFGMSTTTRTACGTYSLSFSVNIGFLDFAPPGGYSFAVNIGFLDFAPPGGYSFAVNIEFLDFMPYQLFI